jgi:hypothetical protein
MNSPEEKNIDTISTSGSMLFDLDVNNNESFLSKKHNNKMKNKPKYIFKVDIPKKSNYKNYKSNYYKSVKNNKVLFDFEIPNFLQDKCELLKIGNEINNYEKKVKNYSNEEKDIFLTKKENFIISIINKYNLPLWIYRNNIEN